MKWFHLPATGEAVVPFTLFDSNGSGGVIKGRLVITPYSIDFYADGHGTSAGDGDRMMLLEMLNGRLSVAIWDDINRDGPQEILLEGSRHEYRMNGQPRPRDESS